MSFWRCWPVKREKCDKYATLLRWTVTNCPSHRKRLFEIIFYIKCVFVTRVEGTVGDSLNRVSKWTLNLGIGYGQTSVGTCTIGNLMR